tara:strand:- start:823 stop:2010 length:1188 start_codon:yes stop_codon:yes gene_type:complete
MTVRTYFSWMLALFVASFLVLPTSKMGNNFYYIFIAIPGLYLLLRNYKLLKPINSTEWVFLILCSVITFYSAFYHTRAIIHALYVLVFVYSISRFVDPNFFSSKTFARMLFWGGLLYTTACAISFYLIGNEPLGTRLNPGISRLYSPIQISMFISCSLFIVGPHWIKDRNFWEGLIGFVLAFLAIALILQSRTGLVGMGVWCAFMLICMVRGFGYKGLIFLVAGLLTLMVISIPMFDLAGQSTELIERGDSHRLAIWNGYLLAWRDCGVMLGCGYPETPSPHLVWQPDGSEVFITHNILVNLLYHYGIVPLILFSIMILSILNMAWQQKNWWGGFLFAGVFTLMLDSNSIINNPDEVWLMLWLPFALILAKEWQSKRETIKKTINWSGTPIVDSN